MKLKLEQPIDSLSYNVDQFCLATGLGRSETYADIKQGKLKIRKRGRRTVILKADGEAYLRSLPEA